MKLKVFLEDEETMHDADEALYKAVTHHSSGDAHTESFQDPAMEDFANNMICDHEKMVKDMMREISDLLDQEYGHDYF